MVLSLAYVGAQLRHCDIRQLSTLEATCAALAQLAGGGGDAGRFQP